MRLFAALPLSDEAIERLMRLRLRLSAPGDGLRWSTPEQWHITLQFYGDVEESTVTALASALRVLASAAAPALTISTLGRFAAKGILFAAVEATPELHSVHDLLAQASAGCGIVPERRAFRPHITLARSKGPAGLKTLQRLCTPDLPAVGPEIRWVPSRVLLVRSTLRPQGAEYTNCAHIDLSPTVVHGQKAG